MAAPRGWQRFGSSAVLWWVDAAAAAVITGAATVAAVSVQTRAPVALVVVVAVMSASTVAWRRVRPYLATVVAVVGVAVYQRLTSQSIADLQPFAVVLCAYLATTVAIERRELGRLAILTAVTAAAILVMASNSPMFDVATVVQVALPVIVAPIVAGWVVTRHHNLTRRLALTRALLEDEQELRVARAATDERMRMARDLHDVVGHAVSVMVIHAGVARLTMLEAPSTAETALRRIVAVGQEAAADLRRLVESEPVEDGESTGGSTTVTRLAGLAREVSDAGIQTRLVIGGPTEALTDEVGQLVYRVVQEALTNAMKHVAAGHALIEVRAGKRVDVRVVSSPSDPTRSSDRVGGGGHGLLGMRERVAQHGGTLQAGPLPNGEFEVHASVPLAPATAEPRSIRSRHRGPIGAAWAAAGRWHRSMVFAAAAFVVLEVDALVSTDRRGPLAVNVLFVGGLAAVTLWRRSRPLAMCVAINALAVPLSGGLADITQATLVSSFVFVVPVYSVAAWAPVRAAAVGLMVTLTTMIGVGLWHQAPSSVILDNAGLTLALWAVGRLVRVQRNVAEELERASQKLLAERAERERDASAGERNRIVRRLEASVMEKVEGVVAVAEAVLARHPPEGDAAGHAISTIEDQGRAALGEMRAIVGTLRSTEETVAAPIPTEVSAR